MVREFSNHINFRLKLIRNLENLGFCRANNQGFAATDTAFVALLNNDAEAAPGWLAALYRVFENAPEVGMAASKIDRNRPQTARRETGRGNPGRRELSLSFRSFGKNTRRSRPPYRR